MSMFSTTFLCVVCTEICLMAKKLIIAIFQLTSLCSFPPGLGSCGHFFTLTPLLNRHPATKCCIKIYLTTIVAH